MTPGRSIRLMSAAVVFSLAQLGCDGDSGMIPGGVIPPMTPPGISGGASEVTLVVRPTQGGAALANGLVSVKRCREEAAFCGGRTDSSGEFECPDPIPVGEELCIYANCCTGSFIGFGTRDHVQVIDHGGGRMVVSVEIE